MPADAMGELQFLYLTTTGRRTGLEREIEIWFVETGGKLYVMAEHFQKAKWVLNILHNPRVRVRLGDERFEATARVLDRERDAQLWEAVRQLEIEKYGWGDGLPVELTRERLGP